MSGEVTMADKLISAKKNLHPLTALIKVGTTESHWTIFGGSSTTKSPFYRCVTYTTVGQPMSDVDLLYSAEADKDGEQNAGAVAMFNHLSRKFSIQRRPARWTSGSQSLKS